MINILSAGLDSKRKHNRIYYLQKKYETMQDMDKWRRNQYKRFVDVVSSNYMMTRHQRIKAKHIIDHFDLRELMRGNRYQTCQWETVVTAICFYVMRKDNSKRPLPYNTRFVRAVNLNKDIYNVISNKLLVEEESDSLDKLYYLVDKDEIKATL